MLWANVQVDISWEPLLKMFEQLSNQPPFGFGVSQESKAGCLNKCRQTQGQIQLRVHKMAHNRAAEPGLVCHGTKKAAAGFVEARSATNKWRHQANSKGSRVVGSGVEFQALNANSGQAGSYKWLSIHSRSGW